MNKNRIKALALSATIAIATALIAVNAFAAENRPGAAAAELTTKRASAARTRNVRCDRGQSLAKALKRARPGDTILVIGTCNESVVIDTDSLTIAGDASATIDGNGHPSEAVVLVDGARDLALRDLDVVNGSDQGVLLKNATAVLERVNISANATVGIAVDRSDIELIDVESSRNGSGGLDAYAASTIVASGTVSANDNGGDGIQVNAKSYFELRGAAVAANQNVGSGVSIINDSRLQILSFPEAQGSSLVADGNGFAGVGALGAEISVVGSQFFGSGANEIRSTNNLFGFFAPAGGIISPHATARFIATGNAVGMLLEDGASALIVGGLELGANNVGLSATGAGTLTLVSVPPNPATIQGNGLDVDLAFGTRATIDGILPGSLVCDATVLVRGSAACP